MNILVFSTSSRSTTYNLFKEFCNQCRERGHKVAYLMFNEKMKHCTGCKVCAKTGKCVHKDDITKALSHSFDSLVIVSPVYFFSLSSRAELFLDRLYSVNLNGKKVTFILPSGSEGYDSGVDVLQDRLERIEHYCGAIVVPPFNKVTNDRVCEVTQIDKISLSNLIDSIERG